MVDSIDSVNEIVRQLQSWAAGSKGEIPALCKRFEKNLEGVIAEIVDLRRKFEPLPTRLGDLSDLPAELRAELTGVEIDEFEGQLIAVIKAYGGTADLNQILVGLFRKFKIIQTRRFAQQKLW